MNSANPLGDVFKKIERQVKRAKTNLKGRAAAQKVLDAYFQRDAERVLAASVKTGVVTLDVNSSALFQEIEGFHKQALLEKFRAAGMPVREIRARLKSPD
jgi:hypothetical protein